MTQSLETPSANQIPEKGTMRAIVRTRYGSPDVLELREIDRPVLKEGRVLIKVYAASANPIDWHEMRGSPYIFRLQGGLRRPKDHRLGTDIAGRVEAVGASVTRFKPGDEVFGMCGGSFAEYAIAREDRLALKPANCSFEEAASAGVAAITAFQSITDKGQIHPGQKVLVNGASGGVGTFAVQIAKSYGTEVTGVCSTRNLDMVRSIGADHVIDYTREDFTKMGQKYDLIIDAVGNRSVSDLKRALNAGGKCVIAGFSGWTRLLEHMILAPARSRVGNKKVGMLGMAESKPEYLESVKKLIESGKVTPVIDKRYPLIEAPEAIEYLEQGHARGKVVITVEQ